MSKARNLADAVGGNFAFPVGALANAPDPVKPGTVAYFAMDSTPDGWLFANGDAVSRTTYAALFAAIGTTYGVGDGSTTFNLPDLRGEFIRGWDGGRGVDSARVFGSAQSDANKSHSHSGSANSAGAHTHAYGAGGSANPQSGGTPGDGFTAGTSYTTSSAGAHTHTLTINSDGGPEARPRNVALFGCIKT